MSRQPILTSFAVIGLILLPAAAQQKKPPCSAPEHRQFDFWLGDWEVRTKDGKLAGTNRITKTLGGCVLEENWTGAAGSQGRSFNIYSPADQRWHQTWVDANGLLLKISGTFTDGVMTLSGERGSQTGTTLLDRIRWKLLPDGRVQQHWTVSKDGGKTWSDLFLGFYSRKK